MQIFSLLIRCTLLLALAVLCQAGAGLAHAKSASTTETSHLGFFSLTTIRSNGETLPLQLAARYGKTSRGMGGKSSGYGAKGPAAAGQRGAIKGYTRHGLNQAIGRNGGRGVNPRAIQGAVKNPTTLKKQTNGTTLYKGKDATVVTNRAGKVVSTWGKPRGPQQRSEGTKRPQGSGSAQRRANQQGFSYRPKAVK